MCALNIDRWFRYFAFVFVFEFRLTYRKLFAENGIPVYTASAIKKLLSSNQWLVLL